MDHRNTARTVARKALLPLLLAGTMLLGGCYYTPYGYPGYGGGYYAGYSAPVVVVGGAYRPHYWR